MTLDVMLESRIDDNWNIERDRDQSDSWTGFTRSTILDETLPDRYSRSVEQLTKKQTTSKETIKKCAEKVGSSDASSYALQDQGKKVRRDL